MAELPAGVSANLPKVRYELLKRLMTTANGDIFARLSSGRFLDGLSDELVEKAIAFAEELKAALGIEVAAPGSRQMSDAAAINRLRNFSRSTAERCDAIRAEVRARHPGEPIPGAALAALSSRAKAKARR